MWSSLDKGNTKLQSENRSHTKLADEWSDKKMSAHETFVLIQHVHIQLTSIGPHLKVEIEYMIQLLIIVKKTTTMRLSDTTNQNCLTSHLKLQYYHQGR